MAAIEYQPRKLWCGNLRFSVPGAGVEKYLEKELGVVGIHKVVVRDTNVHWHSDMSFAFIEFDTDQNANPP